MKTTVLIPYLGKRPLGFEHFAFSASFIREVDFIFLSDQSGPKTLHPNFRILPFTLSEFNTLARRAVGCEIASNHSMKICDFRPAFGLIFEHLLQDSDYWGYCDVDVLFGGIGQHLQPDVLSRYDVMSMNANYLSGSFTLWRNDPEVNRLFEQSPDWKRLMSSPVLHAFDECGYGLWGKLNEGASIFDIPFEFMSMTHVVRKLEREGRIRSHFRGLVKEVFSEREVLRWAPRHVATAAPQASEAGYAYFHSVLLKNLPSFLIPSWDPMPNEMYISASGYHRTLASAQSDFTKMQRTVERKLRGLPGGLARRLKALKGKSGLA